MKLLRAQVENSEEREAILLTLIFDGGVAPGLGTCLTLAAGIDPREAAQAFRDFAGYLDEQV